VCKKQPHDTYFDLCGLYLQVLENLWAEDPSLHTGVTTISVDLSQAPGDLTEAEKEAIAYVFASVTIPRHLLSPIISWARKDIWARQPCHFLIPF